MTTCMCGGISGIGSLILHLADEQFQYLREILCVVIKCMIVFVQMKVSRKFFFGLHLWRFAEC